MENVEKSIEDIGHRSIAESVARLEPPVVVIEMHRQFGDVLHSTLVVRHIRSSHPLVRVVWAISESYSEAFSNFGPDELGPHAIAKLPKLPDFPADAPYRIRWVEQARSIPGVIRSFGCGVHPWGWKSGTIVDAILENSGISRLAVPRRPVLPIDQEDRKFAQDFMAQHKISRFLAMEYSSYTLAAPSLEWFSEIASQIGIPSVSIAMNLFHAFRGRLTLEVQHFGKLRRS